MMGNYQVRFGGGPMEKWLNRQLASGLPNYENPTEERTTGSTTMGTHDGESPTEDPRGLPRMPPGHPLRKTYGGTIPERHWRAG